jgi:hypothetical protein
MKVKMIRAFTIDPNTTTTTNNYPLH